MRYLWFKSCYVEPILRGEKTDTIRAASVRSYQVGQLVALSVGPQRPFARAIVTAFDLITPQQLGERFAEVRRLYGEAASYRRIGFRVTDILEADNTSAD
jgi:hypothetical protein